MPRQSTKFRCVVGDIKIIHFTNPLFFAEFVENVSGYSDFGKGSLPLISNQPASLWQLTRYTACLIVRKFMILKISPSWTKDLFRKDTLRSILDYINPRKNIPKFFEQRIWRWGWCEGGTYEKTLLTSVLIWRYRGWKSLGVDFLFRRGHPLKSSPSIIEVSIFKLNDKNVTEGFICSCAQSRHISVLHKVCNPFGALFVSFWHFVPLNTPNLGADFIWHNVRPVTYLMWKWGGGGQGRKFQRPRGNDA